MAVDNELVLRIKVQANEAYAAFDEARKKARAFADEMKTVGQAQKQMGASDRYWNVFGQSMGSATEKMSILDKGIRDLTSKGLDKNSSAVKLLKQEYDSLAKSNGFTNLLNSFSGGKFGQIAGEVSKMAGGMGIDLGALGAKGASALGALGASAGLVGIAITGLKMAWDNAILPGIKFNMMLEQQEVAFRVMLGSAEKAAGLMGELKNLSLTTPIAFGEGAKGTKQLLAYGFAQEEIIDNMKMLGTLAGATGTSVGDLVYVYGTLRAQGQAYTRDLMQFGMRGIPIYEYLAKTMNVSAKDIKKMTEAGKIGYPQVEAALKAMTAEGGRFGGMMEAVMDTQQGAVTVMKNTWELFTAELAKPLAPSVTAFAKQGTKLIKAFAPFFEMLMGSIGLLMPSILFVLEIVTLIFQVLNSGFAVLQGILKTIGNIKVAGKTFGEVLLTWHQGLGKVTDWMDKILTMMKSMADWWGFIVKGDFKGLEKWMDEFFNGKEVELPEIYIPATVELNNADAKAVAAKLTKEVQGKIDRSKLTDGFKIDFEEVRRWQEALNKANTGAVYSWEETLDIMAQKTDKAGVGLGIFSPAMMAQLRTGAAEFASDFWNVFLRTKPEGSMDGLEAFYQNGLKAAEAYTKQYDDSIDKAYSVSKALGLSVTETAESVSKEAETAYQSLVKTIGNLQMEAIFRPSIVNEQYTQFLDTLIEQAKAYKRLIIETGKEMETMDITGMYIAAAANGMTDLARLNWEGAMSVWERGTTGEFSNDPMLMQLTMISEKYKKIRADATKAGQELTKFKEDMLEEMELAERSKVWLQKSIDLGEMRINMASNMEQKEILINTQLRDQVALNSVLYKGEEQRLHNMQAQLETAKKLAAIYKGEGAEQGLKDRGDVLIAQGKERRGMGSTIMQDAFQGDMKDFFKTFGAGLNEYLGGLSDTVQGAGLNAISGTDVGKLAMGADPITMVITAFAEMLLSIENVNKSLNFLGTLMDGVKSEIEEPMNKAFKPFVDALTSIGEFLGVVLIPIIEIVGEELGAWFGWIKPVMAIFKLMYTALKPLIKAFIYFVDPIRILFAILNDLFTMLSAVVDATEAEAEDLEDVYDKQVKSLQDLYEVGAISGKEYEEMLAALRSGDVVPETEAEKSMVEMFSQLLEALELLSVSVIAFIDWFYPIFEPFIVGATDALADIIAGFAEMLAGITNAISGLLRGDWTAVWNGFLQMLVGILKMIVNPLIDGLNAIIEAVNSLPGGKDIPTIHRLATGTGNVPQDMMALIHKGEAVVPSTFADALRKGEMTLGGAGTSGGTTVYNINVEGNLITERDFYKKVGSELDKLRKQGYA